tara:strand:+ start:68 stop:760 length:693 start_codon:yes stop_codon:yes gene_type:complete
MASLIDSSYNMLIGQTRTFVDERLYDKDYGYTAMIEPLQGERADKAVFLRLVDTTPSTSASSIVEPYPYKQCVSFLGMYRGGGSYLSTHSVASYNPVLIARPKTSWVREPTPSPSAVSGRLVRIPHQVPKYHPFRINLYNEGSAITSFDLTESDLRSIYEDWNIQYYGGMYESGARITPPLAAHIRVENEHAVLTITLRTKGYYDGSHVLAANRIYDEISGICVDLKTDM